MPNPSRSVRNKSRNQGDSKCAKSPVTPPVRPLRFKKKDSANFYLGKNITTRGSVPPSSNLLSKEGILNIGKKDIKGHVAGKG